MEEIKSIAARISRSTRHVLEKLKFSFEKILDKLKGVREFVLEKKAWLEDEKNQASLKPLYRQAERFPKHLRPGKGRCTATFGFDDPHTMGQVLQAVSLIYSLYHRQPFLHLVFNEKILNAEGGLRGRVRLPVVLWLVPRVLFDGHTRRMLKGFSEWYDTCSGCRGMINFVPPAIRGNKQRRGHTTAENQFTSTVDALFRDMDQFVNIRTVVEEPVQVGDIIIVPLIDVACGMVAGSFTEGVKRGHRGGGGMNAKMGPSAVLVTQGDVTKPVSVENQDAITKVIGMAPDPINRSLGGKPAVSEKAVQTAKDTVAVYGAGKAEHVDVK